MRTVAQSVFSESQFGTLSELPSAGTALENPYVYDAAARELMAMASQGLIKIVEERRSDGASGGLINRLTFPASAIGRIGLVAASMTPQQGGDRVHGGPPAQQHAS